MYCRSEEITYPIEESLEENSGFIDNFARGTAHMFRYKYSVHPTSISVKTLVRFN